MKWNKNIEIILHLVLWLLLLVAAISIVSQALPINKAVAISILTVLILIGLAYFNALFVIPRFFKKGKFVWCFIIFLGLLIGTILLNILLTRFFFSGSITEVYPFNDSATFPGRVGIMRWRVIPLLFITIIIWFISTIYILVQKFLEREQHTTLLEQEKVTHELNFLRSQINPHFLFNALNNLHATVQLKPEKAGDYILKLGDMLRYVLEDCKKDKVSLINEISYIKNYIFFQKQKDEKLQKVRLEVSGEDLSNFYLEPMLFIALVENAFQHSYLENTERQWIDISINLKNEELTFSVRNNLGDQKQNQLGVGLQNVKRRLELLYPNRHSITTEIKGNEYLAELVIKKISS